MGKMKRRDPAVAANNAFVKALQFEKAALRRLWKQFWKAVDAQPRDQTKINRLRAEMPEGGLDWAGWEILGCRRPESN